MKKLWILFALVAPLQVAALEYRNLSLLYTDAPFIPADAAGISLLTSLNAIQGNPDGTFRPNRTVNRAEFLKIALASSPKVRVSKSDAAFCFPDVDKSDWFSQYVCLAKKRGMVSGYPDGEFKPGRTVNYAEALKILGELYDYVSYTEDDEEWYAGYLRAAQWHKTALPASIKFDRPLTRGQMARLAAAFRAEHEGELENYRLTEKNLDLVVAKEIAQRVDAKRAEEEQEEEEQEPEEVVVEEDVFTFPARSSFLQLGSREIIASGMFQPRGESVLIENVTVKFRQEAENIRSLFLVDAKGTRIAELSPDTFDKNDLTWKAQGDNVEDYILPLQGKVLGVEALVQGLQGGFSEELIQVKWISMNVSPMGQEEPDYQLIAANPSYPYHQTARANITSVRNNRPPVIDIEKGERMLLAEFEIHGTQLDSAELQVNHITFTIKRKQGVILSNFTLGAIDTADTIPCSLESGVYINCLNLLHTIGAIEAGSILVQLWGSVDVDASEEHPRLKIDIVSPGSLSTTSNPGEMGHIRWTDGTGVFNWTEFEAPVAEGSIWK